MLKRALAEVALYKPAPVAPIARTKNTKSPNSRKIITQAKKVFIVHGHDHGVKDAVARMLASLNLEPIILHEQSNKGLSLIEKFESNVEGVVFAVVLLTPDDMAYESGKDPKGAKPRPRQNVILELGFFLGKLGRDRVAAIYIGEGIDILSDYSGVAFIPYDNGGWQGELVREMKACGIEIDANKLFGK